LLRPQVPGTGLNGKKPTMPPWLNSAALPGNNNRRFSLVMGVISGNSMPPWYNSIQKKQMPHPPLVYTYRKYSRSAGTVQATALPHKKSNPKKVMPQNKILTQICLSEGALPQN
jgi:hypothetical protein